MANDEPKLDISNVRIAVVGLGYVGLPLACAFGRQFHTIGFDIDGGRISELRQGHDSTLELSRKELTGAAKLRFTSIADDISGCTVYIVTVPTPVDLAKRPDLSPLEKASETIAGMLKPGDTVIYESTVFPGCTEEVCVPILEKGSGLVLDGNPKALAGQIFSVGYSPERINPGDKQHRLQDIRKVTSGSTGAAAEFVDDLYSQIITAGTHKAPSIKVAEASKVVENTQRDANIALMNEFALIFNRLGIDTRDVLEAAATKWNFLNFRPGLVGGHCIGVDPYYLIQKAQSSGYYPDLLIAARRVNEGMGFHIASEVLQLMAEKGINPVRSRVLVLGLAFKEDCPDLRNTRVVDIVERLKGFNMQVDIHDPWVNAMEASELFGAPLVDEPQKGAYDAVVLAVSHDQFLAMGVNGVRAYCKEGRGVLYDVKSVFAKDKVDRRL